MIRPSCPWHFAFRSSSRLAEALSLLTGSRLAGVLPVRGLVFPAPGLVLIEGKCGVQGALRESVESGLIAPPGLTPQNPSLPCSPVLCAPVRPRMRGCLFCTELAPTPSCRRPGSLWLLWPLPHASCHPTACPGRTYDKDPSGYEERTHWPSHHCA